MIVFDVPNNMMTASALRAEKAEFTAILDKFREPKQGERTQQRSVGEAAQH